MSNFEVKDLLATQADGVRHLACRRYCLIKNGQKGACHLYENLDGKLFSVGYGKISTFAVDPIEKKPLYHFYPASKVFSVGGISCNFACPACQNSSIAHFSVNSLEQTRLLSPPELVRLALKTECRGIAFTYNEPTVFAEYTIDTFKLAKSAELYTVYVTNGYMSRELLNLLAPILDGASVDIKAFSPTSFKKITGALSDFTGVLDSCQILKKSGVHLEVVTNITPTVNDSLEELGQMASWIKDNLGENTPFHLTRYSPRPIWPEVPATDYTFFDQVMAQNWEIGLKYTYVGNMPNHSAQNTFCANCGFQLVGRYGYQVIVKGLQPDGRCSHCGQEASFVLGKTG